MTKSTNKIDAAYRRWRHVFFRSLLQTAGDKQITEAKMFQVMANMRLIMDAYRYLNKLVLAAACQCEAEDLARHTRGIGNADLDNVEIWHCQTLLAVAGSVKLPEDWNPEVPKYWARYFGL